MRTCSWRRYEEAVQRGRRLHPPSRYLLNVVVKMEVETQVGSQLGEMVEARGVPREVEVMHSLAHLHALREMARVRERPRFAVVPVFGTGSVLVKNVLRGRS